MKRTITAMRVMITLALAIGAVDLSATPITLVYSGTLTSSLGTLASGSAYSASYTFDPLVAGTGSTSTAVFDNLLSASITIGSFSASIGPGTGLAEIQQDNGVGGEDRYALLGRNPVGSSLIAGLPITAIGFRLDDFTQTAISNALVLLTNPSLSSFAGGSTLLLFFGDPSSPNFQIVSGTVTQLSTRSTVPEPGTLALLGIAAAGLAWRRRRQ
jgi:PEP-CTERM motif